MAQVIGTRIGLTTYTAGTDPRPGRTEHNAERQLLEANVVIGGQGIEAARPTAGKGKALYWNADRTTLQWDTGAGWQDISTNGGGGAGRPVLVAGTAAEGTSDRSARADHTHNLVLATASAHGAMSSTDKAKLDGAVSTATASRLILRDGSGRAQVSSPSAAADIANKGYVDATIGGAAAPVVTSDNNGLATPSILAAATLVHSATVSNDAGTLAIRDAAGRLQVSTPSAVSDAAPKSYVDGQISGHRHDATHITSGTLNSARLPLVTTSAHGAMSNTDKAILDGATESSNAGSLVKRSSSGTFQATTPTLAAEVANKAYVDAQRDTRAPSSHTHDGSAINTGTINAARLPFASSTAAGIIDSTTLAKIDNHTHDAAAINSGVLSASRLPIATPSVAGAMSASDKTRLDAIPSYSYTVAENANSIPVRTSTGTIRAANPVHLQDAATRDYCLTNYWLKGDASGGLVDSANKLVKRGDDSNFLVPSPTNANHPATKAYVDGKTWDGGDITSGTLPAGRIRYSSWAYNTAWGGTGVVRAVHVVSGTYELCFYSSTGRHKTNITPWTPNPLDLLAAEPVEFNRINPRTGEVNTEQREVGVIAEQAGQRLPQFVEVDPEDLDDEGRPQVTGWSYAQWTTAHQVLHRHHHQVDTRQDARLARIEEALGLPPLTD